MLQTLAEKLVNALIASIPRSRPSQNDLEQTRIIAHRGAHDIREGLIENTDKAFEKAQALGCWGIELDIHVTADQQIVVNHDPTLKRLWDQDLAIEDISYQQLHQLAPEVPLLSEVVKKYGQKMHLFIELKAPFIHEKELMTILKNLSPCKDYHLLSLDEGVFTGMKEIPREAMLLVAAATNTKAFCHLSLEKSYGGVLGHYLLLSPGRVKQLADAKQHAGVGFVDSRFGLYREVHRGMRWLFTNQARRVCQCIGD